jgi:hypothetical protein
MQRTELKAFLRARRPALGRGTGRSVGVMRQPAAQGR